MDSKRFRDTEVSYQNLKSRLDSGEIGPDELKTQLKKMMVMDDAGQYWMIGSKTGKWYRYDGNEWKPGDPYAAAAGASIPPGPAPAVEKPIEVRPAVEAPPPAPAVAVTAPLPARESRELSEKRPDRPDTSTICRFCKSKIDAHAVYCAFCGGNQSETLPPRHADPISGEILIRGVNLLSLIFFLGGVGLIAGVVLGATFGVFPILGDLIYQFPIMLREARGKFQGGLLFAAIGGLGGFLAGGAVAVCLGLFYNFLAFVFGGIRLRVKS